MMEDGLFDLVRFSEPNGDVYLYPEFRERADQLLSRRSLEGVVLDRTSSRRPSVLTLSDGYRLVAKRERDKLAKAATERKDFVPEDGNLTFKEISIARALSRRASTNDSSRPSVRFEEPLGFYQDKEGQRTALFRFQPGLDQEWVTEDFMAVSSKISPDAERTDWGLVHYVSEDVRYFMNPHEFVHRVLIANGIFHNEQGYEFKTVDYTSSRIIGSWGGPRQRFPRIEYDVIESFWWDKPAFFVSDFEWCDIIGQERWGKAEKDLARIEGLTSLYVPKEKKPPLIGRFQTSDFDRWTRARGWNRHLIETYFAANNMDPNAQSGPALSAVMMIPDLTLGQVMHEAQT